MSADLFIPLIHLADPITGEKTIEVPIVGGGQWRNDADLLVGSGFIVINTFADPAMTDALTNLTEVQLTVFGEKQANSNFELAESDNVIIDSSVEMYGDKTFQLRSLMHRLKSIYVLPADGTHRPRHVSGPFGSWFVTLWNEWVAAGYLPWASKDWTGSVDSKGADWTDSGVTFDSWLRPWQDTAYSIVESAWQAGAINVRMRGHLVRIFNYGTGGNDLFTPGAGLNRVTLQAHPDIVEGHRRATADVFTEVVVLGEEDRYRSAVDEDAVDAYLKRTRVLSADTADLARLQQIADKALPGNLAPIGHKTYTVNVSADQDAALDALPYAKNSYTVGDRIGIRDDVSGPTRVNVRVQGITTTWNQSRVEVVLDVDTRRERWEQRVERIVTALVSGASNTVPPDANRLAPKAPVVDPEDVVVELYAPPSGTGGKKMVRLSVTWSAVTEDTDGGECTDLSAYVLRWRYVGTGTRGWIELEVQPNQTTGYMEGIEPGREFDAELGARDLFGNTSWTTLEAA